MSNGDYESESEGENEGQVQGKRTPAGEHGDESNREGQEGPDEQIRALSL